MQVETVERIGLDLAEISNKTQNHQFLATFLAWNLYDSSKNRRSRSWWKLVWTVLKTQGDDRYQLHCPIRHPSRDIAIDIVDVDGSIEYRYRQRDRLSISTATSINDIDIDIMISISTATSISISTATSIYRYRQRTCTNSDGKWHYCDAPLIFASFNGKF